MINLKEKILLEEPVDELPAVELEQPITVTDTELEKVAEEVPEEVEKDAFISLFANEVSKNYNDIESFKSIKSTLGESNLDESTKESIIETVEGLIDNRTLEIGIFESILEQLDPDMTKLIDDGKEVAEVEEIKEE